MDSKRRSLSPELSADDRLATFYLQSSAMLSLLDSYGVQVLANATYNRDFVAVRQRSLLNGSLYEFKRLPELDDTGGYGFKGRLWDYVAVVFGEVQETFADVNSGRIHIRLRCPDQASCAVARLHQLQQSALQSILTEDQKHLDGSVSSSFFDGQTVNENLIPLPGVFYVDARRGGSTVHVRRNATVVMKLTISRSDEVDSESGKPAMAYRLDALVYHSLSGDFIAKRNRPGYVCDINGILGCSLCTV